MVVHIWSANSGEVKQTFRSHTSAVRSVRFSPHYGAVASASTDGTIRLHRINAMMDDLEMYVGVRALVFERWCSSAGVRARSARILILSLKYF